MGINLFDDHDGSTSQEAVPLINLSNAPGERAAWDRPKIVIYFWGVCELLFVTNPWQVSSAIRVAVLRVFGADIGADVIFRPRTRVRFPWKLHVGERSWIGEGVWFHNQAPIYIGHDVVISQDTLLTTGTHAHRNDMALRIRPIRISDGVWVTSRCIILGGSDIGRSALVKPGIVVSGVIPPNIIWGTAKDTAGPVGRRFI